MGMFDTTGRNAACDARSENTLDRLERMGEYDADMTHTLPPSKADSLLAE